MAVTLALRLLFGKCCRIAKHYLYKGCSDIGALSSIGENGLKTVVRYIATVPDLLINPFGLQWDNKAVKKNAPQVPAGQA